MRKQISNFSVQNIFFYLIVILVFKLQPVFFQSGCNALMGTITLKGVNSDELNISDHISLSKTRLKSLASQPRNITINDVTGTVMVTDFSNILTSTTLNSSHNGVVLVSGTTTLTLPDPSVALGIKYTIKKIDTSSHVVTISGEVDSESNPQLTEQNSYITIISNGNAWYKIAEYAAASSSSENQTYICNSLGMTFRLIPSGTFVMGSPLDELGRGSNETQYTVTISEPYYIQTTEVTQGQWKAVMGDNPSSFTDCGLNCPVETISWEDAQTFITVLNAMGDGSYTFLTEAQWEYAARAGSNKAFANGEILNTMTDSNLDVMGWYYSNSGSTPHAVAQKQANVWGLFDMHGNVNEWCSDWYGDYPDISVTDPGGASSGSYRVHRGGSWPNYAQYCRSAKRASYSPGNRGTSLGLRLSRTP
ncbi:serine/threonine protein kinase [Candidatus Magnetomorum sp. HK-1]|nr:serine/threonine protein kinase [Candidatus Magnetomorum sp. HK-1]